MGKKIGYIIGAGDEVPESLVQIQRQLIESWRNNTRKTRTLMLLLPEYAPTIL
jgi:hypothetical protein